MSTTEDLLRRTLHAHADRTTYQPARVEDVATRARFLQRRRRRTTGLAVAAAVAVVAVPVGLVLGNDSDRAPEPAPGPTPVVTTTVGAYEDLPQGDPPAIDYVDDDTFVAVDGTRTVLPGIQPGVGAATAAPYRGGLLVATGNMAIGTEVTWVDADGDVRWTRCGSGRIAVSEDGRVIGYATPGGDQDCDAWASPLLTWGPTDGPGDLAELAAPAGERADPVAVTEDEMVYNAIATTNGDSAGAYLAPVTGSPQRIPGLVVATAFDAESRTVAGMVDDEVGVLADVDTGEVLVRFDDGLAPVAFSPDGRYVVTAAFTGDGRPPIVIRDVTTGAQVLAVTDPEPMAPVLSLSDIAWEDDTHLLVGTLTTKQQAIVRIGLDGSVELATPPTRETLAGFLFPART